MPSPVSVSFERLAVSSAVVSGDGVCVEIAMTLFGFSCGFDCSTFPLAFGGASESAAGVVEIEDLKVVNCKRQC